jgi:hypothetical protein
MVGLEQLPGQFAHGLEGAALRLVGLELTGQRREVGRRGELLLPPSLVKLANVVWHRRSVATGP